MNYEMRFVTLYRRQGSRHIPMEKKCKKKKKRLIIADPIYSKEIKLF